MQKMLLTVASRIDVAEKRLDSLVVFMTNAIKVGPASQSSSTTLQSFATLGPQATQTLRDHINSYVGERVKTLFDEWQKGWFVYLAETFITFGNSQLINDAVV